MTDELMHDLSTMTEIALLWNPCLDLFLIDRACDKAICFTTRLHPKNNPKPTLLTPTTDIIALLSGQQHSSSAPATSTHARETPQPSYTRARYAGDGLEEFSGGQSHHLSLQNLSARSHDAAQTFDRWPRRPPDGTPPCAQHMADAERQEAPRARQETLREWWSEPPCPGSAVRAPANVAATSGTFPQLRERSRSFPKGAPRFSDGRHRSAAVSRSPPLWEFMRPCCFCLHAPKNTGWFYGPYQL